MTPHSLLEVDSGLDMTKNLKQHFDNSVQTAIQKKARSMQYYGRDAQCVTAS